MSSPEPPVEPRPPTPGAALRAYALDEMDRSLSQLARSGLARHGGIHQGRKSLRRVRASLALAGGRLGARAERLDRRLRRLCRSLSELRDAHAVLDTLARVRAALPPAERRALRTELRAVRSALKARRDALLAERLARDPGLERLRDRLVVCRTRLESLPWERVGDVHLVRALERSTRRIRRAARVARRSGAIEDLHRWRRRLRRLRQQLNALTSAGLGQGDAVSPDPTELEQLAWQQDLDVLLGAVAALQTVDPALRHAVAAAVRSVPTLSAVP